MCAICGKYYFSNHCPDDFSGLMKRMTNSMLHRGPDDDGFYFSNGVGLGHRRLSIIDLNTGKQPIANEDGSVVVVFNGEIYNYETLRDHLAGKGHVFKTRTDTEVIVHCYEEYGEGFLEKLRGMFAIALWDDRKQILLLARDRVGIKPLYYTVTGKAIVFASEIKSLLADSSVGRAVNLRGIDRFLTHYYMPGRETLFEGIYKLEPGHYLTVSNRQIVERQYWDLRFDSPPRCIQYEEAVAELQQLLRRSVKDHMISDVPVGMLLSGGVDSTGVLRYAAEQSDRRICTFTVGFEGETFADERPFARLAAQRYGTLHRDITIGAEDFRDFLPKYVWHMEEPVCEPPAIALYFVSRLARESSVKVLLSGEGGDEAFGGYQTYRNFLLLERLKSAFGPAKGLLRFGLKAVGRAGWENIGRFGDLVDLPLSDYYLSRTATPSTFFNRGKAALYTRDFDDAVRAGARDTATRALFENLDGQSPLDYMLYVDTKTWLPDDLLVKADKMTMATSVELRVPLLDSRVLEFAASLPPHFKVRGRSTKRILKSALRESVPREILARKKTGFPLPYERWLKRELREFVLDNLLGRESTLTTYFRRDAVREIIRMQQRGAGCSKEVFCLLVLELWHRQFMSGSSSQTYPN